MVDRRMQFILRNASSPKLSPLDRTHSTCPNVVTASARFFTEVWVREFMTQTDSCEACSVLLLAALLLAALATAKARAMGKRIPVGLTFLSSMPRTRLAKAMGCIAAWISAAVSVPRRGWNAVLVADSSFVIAVAVAVASCLLPSLNFFNASMELRRFFRLVCLSASVDCLGLFSPAGDSPRLPRLSATPVANSLMLPCRLDRRAEPVAEIVTKAFSAAAEFVKLPRRSEAGVEESALPRDDRREARVRRCGGGGLVSEASGNGLSDSYLSRMALNMQMPPCTPGPSARAKRSSKV